jgi:hypothetical protein
MRRIFTSLLAALACMVQAQLANWMATNAGAVAGP